MPTLIIILIALVLCVLFVMGKAWLHERTFNALLSIFLTSVITSVLVGSCAFRLGTACGQFDAAMPLQKCLTNPRG